MRRPDGQQVVILENARAVRDSGDRIVGYEGTIANITERKRAEQAIFAEKERAQVTLQSIGDAVISTDADGRIEYINPVAESLTAWSLAEARGRPIGDVLNLVNEITREPIENPLICALGRGEAGAPVDHSVLITRAGQEVAIQESAAPICDRQAWSSAPSSFSTTSRRNAASNGRSPIRRVTTPSPGSSIAANSTIACMRRS